MKAGAVAIATLVLVSACAAHATTSSELSSPSAATSQSNRGSTSATHTRKPPAPPFDRTRHSLTDPRSIWVIVNKRHPITPLDFQPTIALVRGYQVAVAAARPLAHLLDTADRDGVPLKIASAYRSFDYQEGVHANLVATLGQGAADAISARPGYSEHQTGLAVDLQPLDGTCALEACFVHTRAGRWLAAHAWRFGFLVRYTEANRRVTGYAPEPWHFRYVGTALAREVHDKGSPSLEGFFGVTGGDYD